ncbi:MAG: serine--tRNA ligase [Candidatus Sungiibacteriota bacterium]
MLDIKFIRENPEKVKKALRDRNADFDLDYFLELDARRRAKISEVDGMRSRQNEFADEIARSSADARAEKIAESRALKEKLGHLEFELKVLEEEFDELMRKIPNMPDSETPIGKDEHDNSVVREVGEKPQFNFQPRDYMAISMRSGLIDMERAAKVSGSRFGYIMGDLARLEFALVQFAFDRLGEKGFIPIVPPVMVREEMMRGMGYIDTTEDREERYELAKDKLFLVGTSEQSVVSLHADEIFDENDLPRRYVAFSTCFRREAGSYGKDTQGILRVHQFDKVEMVSFTKPEDSMKEHEFLLAAQEELMQALKLPYRVVALCTGDIARPSAATYDIEAWLPGQNKSNGEYRETHSSSNTTDFQARRLNIKFRNKDNKLEFAHILNGTAFAIGRMIIAIMENYQQEDGSVAIPDVLQPYMGGLRFIKQ